mmetsp:Transcript_5577/g.7805  ORF Transcript_5577/g.7805 Transcript_5577/m.7805 type:complete len:91 (-) Transcript_5577:18-290(-)
MQVFVSPRREALRLYRDVLRVARQLDFINPSTNRSWKDTIHESARKEFEIARFERDPETIARLITVGRSCLNEVKEKIAIKQHEILTSRK